MVAGCCKGSWDGCWDCGLIVDLVALEGDSTFLSC